MHGIPQEGILVVAQLVEKVVYVDMKALEEEAAVSCWRPVGARTDRKLGLITQCAWRLVALTCSASCAQLHILHYGCMALH